LTDQQGLFDADPRRNSAAKLITEAAASDSSLDGMAGGSAGLLGRGGMVTKLRAARLAARSGTNTVIASGKNDDVLLSIIAGESVGTLLIAEQQPLLARKQWLAGMTQLQGVVELDEGAVKVLRDSGRSLLPVGVRALSGVFGRGALVSCVDGSGKEVARGLINYSSDEAEKILGKVSGEIEALLGFQGEKELIHRDNMVVV
jgi:glutamate 5-kinase